MSTISNETKALIRSLLIEGTLDRDEIAARANVAPGTVSAIKAHMTMGTYGDTPSALAETEELITASETTFKYERDLQYFLRANLEQLEAGLQIADDGRERRLPGGRIDITARDRNGELVVIELKRGTAAPEALTQLLSYMGTVTKEQAKPVRGILVATEFDRQIEAAVAVVSNVQLRRYSVTFNFKSVG